MALRWIVPSREVFAPALVYFRKKFSSAVAETVRFEWSADEKADLFLDGKFLTSGPQRGTKRRWFMDPLELTLTPGEHCLVAKVYDFGEARTAFGQETLAFGFYVGDPEWLQGWEWKVLDHVSWENPLPDWGLYPRIRGEKEMDFEILSPDDPGWEPAAFREDERELSPRMLPAMTDTPYTAYHTVPHEGGTLFVFDDYVSVRCEYVMSGEGSISFQWAECFYEPGSFDDKFLDGVKGDRREFSGKVWQGNGDEFQLPGRRVVWHDLHWRSGRYLWVKTSGTAKCLEARFFHCAYPWKREWEAECSIPEFTKVLSMAWRTLEMCSHDTFMDCPFFEQMQYISDGRLEVLSLLPLTHDPRLIVNFLRTIADTQSPSGLVFSRTPSRWPQVIPSFALIYVLLVNDVARWMGRSVAEPFFDCVKGILRYFETRAADSPDELLHFPGWDRVDTPNWKDGDVAWNYLDWTCVSEKGMFPGDASLNILFLLALETAAALFPDKQEEYDAAADNLASAISSAYQVTGKGYAETADHTVFTEHAQALATLSRRLPIPRLDLEGAVPTGVSFSYYYLEAARRQGRGDLFLARVQKWFDLTKEGLCTLPENFGKTRSDCHAWSAHVLNHYFTNILGLQVLDREKNLWQLNPFPIGMAFAQGTIPMADGKIFLRLEQSGKECKLIYRNSSSAKLTWRGNLLKEAGELLFSAENA